MTYGSLFSGYGGDCLGLTRAGLECKWQVEIKPDCLRVLAKHWPKVTRHDDVRTFPPEGDWRVDLICGGDPCQENSGARATGTCSQPSLGGEFIRVVDELRPRLVLRENPAHVRRDAPWPWWRFRDSLESLGYAVLPFRFRACCIGAVHRRERVFLLGELSNAHGNGLEGRQGASGEAGWIQPGFPRLVEGYDWPAIPADLGHRSRAGLPRYVERVTGLGNAIVPQVAEWIGRRLMMYT